MDKQDAGRIWRSMCGWRFALLSGKEKCQKSRGIKGKNAGFALLSLEAFSDNTSLQLADADIIVPKLVVLMTDQILGNTAMLIFVRKRFKTLPFIFRQIVEKFKTLCELAFVHMIQTGCTVFIVTHTIAPFEMKFELGLV